MGDDNDKKIHIKSIIGGGLGPDLVDCFFKRKLNGKFDFFDKDGNEKKKDLPVGAVFMFSLDEVPDVMWALSIAEGSDTSVSGSWSSIPSPPSPADEGDQTYTAQAGGTPVDEKENAASASTY